MRQTAHNFFENNQHHAEILMAYHINESMIENNRQVAWKGWKRRQLL